MINKIKMRQNFLLKHEIWLIKKMNCYLENYFLLMLKR